MEKFGFIDVLSTVLWVFNIHRIFCPTMITDFSKKKFHTGPQEPAAVKMLETVFMHHKQNVLILGLCKILFFKQLCVFPFFYLKDFESVSRQNANVCHCYFSMSSNARAFFSTINLNKTIQTEKI